MRITALILPFVLALPSCGLIKDTAKEASDAAVEVFKREAPGMIAKVAEAAKTYWDNNKTDILTGSKKAADAALEFAKTYWAENKDNLIKAGKDAALEIKDKAVAEALAQAKLYTDAKLKDLNEKTLQALYAKGYSKAELDLNGDGTVTEEETVAFMKKNPMAVYYGGASALLLLAGWYAKQAAAKKTTVETASAS